MTTPIASSVGLEMKIGVVSDTHNNRKNVSQIIELFNELNVTRVVHTGDITKASTLDQFTQLNADLFGVFGNNDQERDSLEESVRRNGFHIHSNRLEVEWHGRRVLVVHDPNDLNDADFQDFDLTLHGHTHLMRMERRHGCLVFNPGESAGHMSGYNAIGIVDLSAMTAEIVNF